MTSKPHAIQRTIIPTWLMLISRAALPQNSARAGERLLKIAFSPLLLREKGLGLRANFDLGLQKHARSSTTEAGNVTPDLLATNSHGGGDCV